MHDGGNGIVKEIWIEAPPERVFRYFTEIDLWRRWQAIEGIVEAVPGGAMRLRVADSVAAGEFLVVDPPRRLVLTWGWEGHDLLPPGSSTVEVLLVEEGSGTRVRLAHTGLPEPEMEVMAEGWEHYLARLEVSGSGGDPGPDPWVANQ